MGNQTELDKAILRYRKRERAKSLIRRSFSFLLKLAKQVDILKVLKFASRFIR